MSMGGIDFVGALGAAPADVETGLGIAAANGYSGVDSGNQLSIPQYTPEQAALANAVATELGQTTSADQQAAISNGVLAQQNLDIARQQEAARQAYEQQQALATELQAGLLDEQARSSNYDPYAHGIASGSPTGAITFDPIFGDYHGLSRFGPAIARDPSGNALLGHTILGNIPYMGIGAAARGFLGGASPFANVSNFMDNITPDNEFGEFPGDAVSPSLPDAPSAPPVTPVAGDVPAVVVAPTPSEIFANAQPYYRPTLLDQAPVGMANFDALNRDFNLSYAMRPDIYENPPALDLLGRQGYVPL